MSRYTMVRTDVWMDSEFTELNNEEKLLYIYLLTSPLSNLAGFYKLPVRQIECDVGIKKTKILPMLLDQKKLWKYDADTEQVLIPTYLKYNKARNKMQYKAIASQVDALKKCELHIYFIHCLNKHSGEEAVQMLPKEIKVYVREQCRGNPDPIKSYIYNLLSREDIYLP